MVFTIKTLIFSKTVDETHTKMLETNVKHWIAMKPSHFSNELLLVSQKKHIICSHTN